MSLIDREALHKKVAAVPGWRTLYRDAILALIDAAPAVEARADVDGLVASPARLYDALWLLKASRYGDDDEFPTLPEVRLALAALLAGDKAEAPLDGCLSAGHTTYSPDCAFCVARAGDKADAPRA